MLRTTAKSETLAGSPFPTRPVRQAAATAPVVLLHRHFQPRLDPAQQPPVAHAPGHRLHQLRVRYLAEVVRQVGVHHLPVARRQPVYAPDRVTRVSARPVGILLRFKVRFEDRRQHQHRRRLRHPVPETRYAQWPKLPALLLRDEDLSPHAAGRSPPSSPAPVLPTTGPPPATRCPRPSRRPPRPTLRRTGQATARTSSRHTLSLSE